MLHQIWEIAVARERIKVAWETIAGSGAAPPLSMFLERRERGAGNCAVRLCLTGQVMEGRGLVQVCVCVSQERGRGGHDPEDHDKHTHHTCC